MVTSPQVGWLFCKTGSNRPGILYQCRKAHRYYIRRQLPKCRKDIQNVQDIQKKRDFGLQGGAQELHRTSRDIAQD
jgi:hypothetical protein